jgi:hypothetical protein
MAAEGSSPTGEREGPGLAGLRAGQQSVLDLRRQAQRAGALPPLVQVGVPPVGDHHERQHVSQPGDLRDGLGVRSSGQRELQDPDGLAAFGHRSKHQPLVVTIGCLVPRRRVQKLHALGADGLLSWSAVERQQGRGLLERTPLVGHEGAVDPVGGELDVRQPDQGTT